MTAIELGTPLIDSAFLQCLIYVQPSRADACSAVMRPYLRAVGIDSDAGSLVGKFCTQVVTDLQSGDTSRIQAAGTVINDLNRALSGTSSAHQAAVHHEIGKALTGICSVKDSKTRVAGLLRAAHALYSAGDRVTVAPILILAKAVSERAGSAEPECIDLIAAELLAQKVPLYTPKLLTGASPGRQNSVIFRKLFQLGIECGDFDLAEAAAAGLESKTARFTDEVEVLLAKDKAGTDVISELKKHISGAFHPPERLEAYEYGVAFGRVLALASKKGITELQDNLPRLIDEINQIVVRAGAGVIKGLVQGGADDGLISRVTAALTVPSATLKILSAYDGTIEMDKQVRVSRLTALETELTGTGETEHRFADEIALRYADLGLRSKTLEHLRAIEDPFTIFSIAKTLLAKTITSDPSMTEAQFLDQTEALMSMIVRVAMKTELKFTALAYWVRSGRKITESGWIEDDLNIPSTFNYEIARCYFDAAVALPNSQVEAKRELLKAVFHFIDNDTNLQPSIRTAFAMSLCEECMKHKALQQDGLLYAATYGNRDVAPFISVTQHLKITDPAVIEPLPHGGYLKDFLSVWRIAKVAALAPYPSEEDALRQLKATSPARAFCKIEYHLALLAEALRTHS